MFWNFRTLLRKVSKIEWNEQNFETEKFEKLFEKVWKLF